MKLHRCFDDSYPSGAIACACARGEDHPEALFDIPVDSGVELATKELTCDECEETIRPSDAVLFTEQRPVHARCR